MPPRRALLGGLALAAVVVGAVCLAGPAVADRDAGQRKAEPCAVCHGRDGNAIAPGMPSLAGQPAWFTHWALIKFRDGRRQDPGMSPVAAKLSDEDMADLAAHFEVLRPERRPQPVDASKAAEGKALATAQHCLSCHRPDLSGQKQVPRLAGQDLTYLRKALQAYRAQTAGDLDGMMTQVARALTDADIERLVHFLAGFP